MSDTAAGGRSRLGYVGLGAMGGAMVEAACAVGWSPRVYDLDSGRVEAAVAVGAVAATDPAAVARASDVVGVCVPAAEHVEAVLGGPDGLATGAADRPTDAGDLVVLVHSTVAADDIRRWHAAFRRERMAVHDAAVAGGAAAARAGDLVLLVGGLADLDGATRGVLDAYAGLVLDAGPVGAGAVLKLAVNVMTYAQQAAAAAAWDLVADAGGDPTLLLGAWRHTGQLGRLTEQYAGLLELPAEAVAGDLARLLAATAAIAHKDLDLAAGSVAHPVWRDLLTAIDAAVGRTLRLEG